MHKKVVVIGGGAAGFFAAINLAKHMPGDQILILEKTTKVLSKVKVSGGGRCNVTHACFDPKELTAAYPRGEKELLGPFHHFFPSDTIQWFEERGIALKIEEDGRMFPVTNSSQTIIDCFLSEANQLGVKLWNQAEVSSVKKSTVFEIVLKDGKSLTSDYLIVATGGSPAKKHYHFIESLGHQVVGPIPSLFTFNLPKHPSNQLMGLAQEATVKLLNAPFEVYGPVLFTHWGMSGPAILKLSSLAANFLHQKNYQFVFEVEWMSNAANFIENKRKNAANKRVNVSGADVFSKRFWSYLLERAELPEEVNWADLKKSQLEKLIQVLERDTYHAQGKTTFKEEFVSCGGVNLKEMDMKSMQSKIVSGLYFCGEVMNVDGLTGGFNFQAAWTTSWIAAKHIGAQ